jgi:glucoamylase
MDVATTTSIRRNPAPARLAGPPAAPAVATDRTTTAAATSVLNLMPALGMTRKRDDGPAPNGPGGDAYWTSANKTGIGTANNRNSKVWFTLSGGRMTEVYYPSVDRANMRELKFAVSDGRTFTIIDSEAPKVTVTRDDKNALVFKMVSEDPVHGWKLTRTYLTDPKRDSVMIDVDFESTKPLDLYVIANPALGNQGGHNHGGARDGALVAENNGTAMALRSSIGYQQTSTGYWAATSDPVLDLLNHHHLSKQYSSGHDGQIVQVGKLCHGRAQHLTLSLSFGPDAQSAQQTARASLADGFSAAREQYCKEWKQYLDTLSPVNPEFQDRVNLAAMVLKAHGDKINPGAYAASLSLPWGQQIKANEPTAGGYHLIWARDDCNIASAFRLLGDKQSAGEILDYLFEKQQRPDGSFPQNAWIDGRPYWGGLQMDEVALPIVLAQQLGKWDSKTYHNHIKPAADFITQHGPATPQERWEESDGYSPSTLADEIAGLVCAADIAEKVGDAAGAAHYRDVADQWRANYDKWTVTRTGPHGDEYYIRINDDQDPDDGARRRINNGGGEHDEREVVDGGFLEAVKMGVHPPQHGPVVKSVAVIDKLLHVMTGKGPGWYRYNHDGYGEKKEALSYDGTGEGRLWPLLAGERGEWELARGNREAALGLLHTMENMANETGMIPEQVWDRDNHLHDPHITIGEAARRLTEHYDTVAKADGNQDGFISKSDLNAALLNPCMPLGVRQASQFLLDHPQLLELVDVAAGIGGFDDKIGRADLDRVSAWCPPGVGGASQHVEAGAGHGTGSSSPLAWAMAQYVRLAVLLSRPGQPTDVPEPMRQRYLQAGGGTQSAP